MNSECSPFLEKALLSFFSYTTVSSAIIESLAEGTSAPTIDMILAQVRDIRRLEIPETAIESSLLILTDAGLVSLSADSYSLTETGKELAEKLARLRIKLD